MRLARKSFSCFLFLCCTCSAVLLPHHLAHAAQVPVEPHPFTAPATADCLKCHMEQPTGTPTGNLIPDSHFKDTSTVCISCHQAEGESHPMKGVKLDFKPPADLPLDETGEMTCITCHSVHGERYSSRDYCSESPLSRALGRLGSKKRKTYFLRRPNSHGELCLACHK